MKYKHYKRSPWNLNCLECGKVAYHRLGSTGWYLSLCDGCFNKFKELMKEVK